MITLIFDTETSGKADFKNPHDYKVQPYAVQFAAVLVEDDNIVAEVAVVIDNDIDIDPFVTGIHGIDRASAKRTGISQRTACSIFKDLFKVSDRIAGHNVDFDLIIMKAALAREGMSDEMFDRKVKPRVCTMKTSTDIMKLKGNFGYKYPKLTEAHEYYLGCGFEGAHDALADVKATYRVLQEMEKRGIKMLQGSM